MKMTTKVRTSSRLSLHFGRILLNRSHSHHCKCKCESSKRYSHLPPTVEESEGIKKLNLLPLERLDIAKVFPPKDLSSRPPICAPSSSKAYSYPDYSSSSIARVNASGKIAASWVCLSWEHERHSAYAVLLIWLWPCLRCIDWLANTWSWPLPRVWGIRGAHHTWSSRCSIREPFWTSSLWLW